MMQKKSNWAEKKAQVADERTSCLPLESLKIGTPRPSTPMRCTDTTSSDNKRASKQEQENEGSKEFCIWYASPPNEFCQPFLNCSFC